LETEAEVAAIGLDELIRNGDSVIAIEWIDRFPRLMSDAQLIRFEIVSATERRLELP
jgi:tRNA A37 threonylcarbamoyladenosine biosynthesis protein TsaE